MPYEMILTDARDLSAETVGFGENQEMAQRVFNWTWHGLMYDGYMSLINAKTPNHIEILQRRGGTVLFMELRYRPPFDLANLLRLINMLALDRVYPRSFASGLLQGEVIQAEKAWAEVQYIAHVTRPDGQRERHLLPSNRAEAIMAFTQMVQAQTGNVQRCADADLKWMALDEKGATTLEFVEVQK